MADWTTTPFDASAGGALSAADWDSTVRDGFNAFGAWSSYTPTLTGFTLGSGTVAGGYMRVQKLVAFWATFTYGSGSAATTTPQLTLPVTATSTSLNRGVMRAQFSDVSASANYAAIGVLNTTTTAAAYITGSSGLYTLVTTTTPFTWATGDVLYISGIYEAA